MKLYEPSDPYEINQFPTLEAMWQEIFPTIWNGSYIRSDERERCRELFFKSYGFFLQTEHLLNQMDPERAARTKESLLEEHLIAINHINTVKKIGQ